MMGEQDQGCLTAVSQFLVHGAGGGGELSRASRGDTGRGKGECFKALLLGTIFYFGNKHAKARALPLASGLNLAD